MNTISIIVPVYNVEQYLERCIVSLINQTYSHIEILLINDGSTDGSGNICDDFSKVDKRIRTYHKKNGGLSDARNFGLLHSRGDFILFVDSDDYIEENTCDSFMMAIDGRKVDIAVGNSYIVKKNQISKIVHTYQDPKKILTGPDFLLKELKHNTMHMAVCFNLYRREFIIQNNLFFKKGLIHEDEDYTPRAFLKAKRIIATNIIFYNYLIRENSITTQNNKIKNVRSLLEIVLALEGLYSKITNMQLKKLLQEHSVVILINSYKSLKFSTIIEHQMYDLKFLIRNSNTIKSKLKSLLFILYFSFNKICNKKDV